MANKPESALDAITSLGSTFVRMISSGGESVKATIANVAKYIIETYASSSLAGSNQSVKSAIDSLNSKALYWITNTGLPDDLDSFPDMSIAWANGTRFVHRPTASAFHVITVNTVKSTHGFQLAIQYNNHVYVRTKVDNTWGDWLLIK